MNMTKKHPWILNILDLKPQTDLGQINYLFQHFIGGSIWDPDLHQNKIKLLTFLPRHYKFSFKKILHDYYFEKHICRKTCYLCLFFRIQ